MGKTVLPLISIIIPVYNVEQYLEQCIESIINQTYTNIQIILVDDGSIDDSGKICDKYICLDNRIEVIHKKNAGLVSARKEGISIAKGEYVAFVDGDDWIEPDTFQRLVDIGNNADIITFSCVEEYGDYQIVKKNKIKEGLYLRDNKAKLYEKMLMGNTFFEFGILPHLCDKLIRRKILFDNQMNVDSRISYGEDVACTFPCILDADSVYVTNMPLYHYRQRTGSIVKKSDTVQAEVLSVLYSSLKRKFVVDKKAATILLEQLHYYLWFVLLVKSYSKLHGTMTLFPFSKVSNKDRIVIYGAGGFGTSIKHYCDSSQCVNVIGWSDLHYDTYQKQGLDVVSIEQILSIDFDCIIIAILNEDIAKSVKSDLVKKGIPEKKIDWVKKKTLKCEKLPDWVESI